MLDKETDVFVDADDDKYGREHFSGDIPDILILPPEGYAGRESNRVTHTRRHHIYVGNLTWWTTDREVEEAMLGLGIHDCIEVKFHENRANGQSKGFCCVTLASELSVRKSLEGMPKLSLHGRNPVVALATKQALKLFEAAAKARPNQQQQQQQSRSSNCSTVTPTPPPAPPPGFLRPPPPIVGHRPRPRPPRGITISHHSGPPTQLIMRSPACPLSMIATTIQRPSSSSSSSASSDKEMEENQGKNVQLSSATVAVAVIKQCKVIADERDDLIMSSIQDGEPKRTSKDLIHDSRLRQHCCYDQDVPFRERSRSRGRESCCSRQRLGNVDNVPDEEELV